MIHATMHTYIHAYIQYIHASNTYIQTYIHTHTYIHTNIHTYMHASNQESGRSIKRSRRSIKRSTDNKARDGSPAVQQIKIMRASSREHAREQAQLTPSRKRYISIHMHKVTMIRLTSWPTLSHTEITTAFTRSDANVTVAHNGVDSRWHESRIPPGPELLTCAMKSQNCEKLGATTETTSET